VLAFFRAVFVLNWPFQIYGLVFITFHRTANPSQIFSQSAGKHSTCRQKVGPAV